MRPQPTSGARYDWSKPLRVLTYSHDSYGLGHLRRSLTMASALLRRGSQVQALCLTGSPVPGLFPLPERCDVIKLPAIGKDERGNYVSRHLPISFDEVTRLRSDMITSAVRSFRPDLLLVDHTPMGPGGELLPVLRRLRHEGMQTRVVLGMRDVLDAPMRASEEMQRNGAFDVMRSCYDQILVYGMPEILDVTEYGFPEDLARKTTYVGCVVPESVSRRQRAHREGPPRVLVTAGGGEDGYQLLRGIAAAVRGPLRGMDLEVTLVAGPLMPAARVANLARAMQGDRRMTLLPTTQSMHELQARSDLVMGMGGYNTVYETLAAGVRLLVLPRRFPREEQWERCRRLAARNCLGMLSQSHADDPHLMAAAMQAALDSSPTAARELLRFDGAAVAAAHLIDLRRQPQPAATAALAR